MPTDSSYPCPSHTAPGLPDNLSVVLLGASGDLARKKIVPALFALYADGRLPQNFRLFGFARTPFTHEAFRSALGTHVACRTLSGTCCAQTRQSFLARCFYVAGAYDSADSFLDLFEVMRREEPARDTHRIFYLATPPSVFLAAARALGDAGLVRCENEATWTRAVIEKPFGRDRASSDDLVRELARVFTERQIYRIDHYLGKEAVQNLMALRFANRVFEPFWNRHQVEQVLVDWAEDIGIADRGGYYDRYGIVRDVVQNHLLQVLALVAMERPAGFGPQALRRAKLDVLRSIAPPAVDAFRLGQYAAGTREGRTVRGYREEKGVAPNSRTPTFAAVTLAVQNERWRGVPFLIRAGKALDRRATEVRILFRPVANDLFPALSADRHARNELIIRIQPDEAVRLRIVSKKPGLHFDLAETELNLIYGAAFTETVPDAYERLLLDVMQGENSLFIHADELAAAWDIFTPALAKIENRGPAPFPYPFGSSPDALGGSGV
jgi:glucose-6-phosphate 1-dehydrogenase